MNVARVPRRELHGRHAARRLPGSLSPPIDRGTTWSAVVATNVQPGSWSWHSPPSRSITAREILAHPGPNRSAVGCRAGDPAHGYKDRNETQS
jgi:hypothetical protein